MSLIKVRDFAAHCGVDPRTVRNWMAKGAAAKVQIGPKGHTVRLTEADAQRLSGKTWKKVEKEGKRGKPDK